MDDIIGWLAKRAFEKRALLYGGRFGNPYMGGSGYGGGMNSYTSGWGPGGGYSHSGPDSRFADPTSASMWSQIPIQQQLGQAMIPGQVAEQNPFVQTQLGGYEHLLGQAMQPQHMTNPASMPESGLGATTRGEGHSYLDQLTGTRNKLQEIGSSYASQRKEHDAALAALRSNPDARRWLEHEALQGNEDALRLAQRLGITHGNVSSPASTWMNLKKNVMPGFLGGGAPSEYSQAMNAAHQLATLEANQQKEEQPLRAQEAEQSAAHKQYLGQQGDLFKNQSKQQGAQEALTRGAAGEAYKRRAPAFEAGMKTLNAGTPTGIIGGAQPKPQVPQGLPGSVRTSADKGARSFMEDLASAAFQKMAVLDSLRNHPATQIGEMVGGYAAAPAHAMGAVDEAMKGHGLTALTKGVQTALDVAPVPGSGLLSKAMNVAKNPFTQVGVGMANTVRDQANDAKRPAVIKAQAEHEDLMNTAREIQALRAGRKNAAAHAIKCAFPEVGKFVAQHKAPSAAAALALTTAGAYAYGKHKNKKEDEAAEAEGYQKAALDIHALIAGLGQRASGLKQQAGQGLSDLGAKVNPMLADIGNRTGGILESLREKITPPGERRQPMGTTSSFESSAPYQDKNQPFAAKLPKPTVGMPPMGDFRAAPPDVGKLRGGVGRGLNALTELIAAHPERAGAGVLGGTALASGAAGYGATKMLSGGGEDEDKKDKKNQGK